jgi:lycopene cyclase domain-containing protein
MRHLTYLAVLAGCLLGALWVEPVLHVHVVRRWRRLAITLAVVVVIFGGWDVAAVTAGHWRYDPAQTLGVRLLAGLPLEELLFFLIVPFAAILGFEAVRAVRGSVAPAGDEVLDPPVVDAARGQADGPGRPERCEAGESRKRREPAEPHAPRDPAARCEPGAPREPRTRQEPGALGERAKREPRRPEEPRSGRRPLP